MFRFSARTVRLIIGLVYILIRLPLGHWIAVVYML